MKRILERYIPTAGEHFERLHFSRTGKRDGMPLNFRAELPEELSAIEIACLWTADEETRAALERAITEAAKLGKLKAAGWYEHLIQRMPPKVTRKVVPPKEPRASKPPETANKRRGRLPPAPKRPPVLGTIGIAENADITKRVPLLHRNAFGRWLKDEEESVPEGLARWLTTKANGEPKVFDVRAEALRAVMAERKAQGREQDQPAPTSREVYELSGKWRRKQYGDARGFPSYSTWLRDFWKKGGRRIYKTEK